MRKRKNDFLKGLYDMAESKDENGLSVFDEQKLRREMESNRNFMRRNKDMFSEGEHKFYSCPRYDACPICEKCRTKASHLYVSCQTCKIPICVHSYKDINRMILRKNFLIKIKRPEFKKAFLSLKETRNE